MHLLPMISLILTKLWLQLLKRKFLLERMLEDRQHFPDEDDNDEDNAYVPDGLRNGLHYHYR